ncbi:DUF5330 domain-containing protein [Bartonella sp. CB175]|uniref:DUF5330 domain-containing protein n=1 Tax=Bartonella sp. CB175 TaxID=3112256 RepID=UPI00300E68AE
MIRLLIKLSFFLFFIFLAISFFSEKPNGHHFSTPIEKNTTISDVIIAFKETISDFGTFCERNTETCKIGKSFFNSLSERARYGAKAVYEYFRRVSNDKNKNSPENSSFKANAQKLKLQ